MRLAWLNILIILSPVMIYAQEKPYDRIIFDNSLMTKSWYYSAVNYDSPSYVLNVKGKLPVENQESFTPGNSLHLNYTSSSSGSWIVELNYPKWRGKDFFKEADVLSFWIYVAKKTETGILPMVNVSTESLDSRYIAVPDIVGKNTSEQWQQMKIPLENFGKDFTDSKKITSISFRQADTDSGEGEILIDQVEFINSSTSGKTESSVEIAAAKGYDRHVDLTWEDVNDNTKYIKIYRSQNGSAYEAIGIQNTREFSKFTDFTGETDTEYTYKISALAFDYSESDLSQPVKVSTKKMSDEELMTMVQEAAFQYYWSGAEVESGLALENIPGRKNMIASGASGFGLMALIVGAEREFISRTDFLKRMEKIVSFLENADRFHGAYSHFIDGPTGKVEPFFGQYDNGADLVETSFLMQGLLTVRQYLSTEVARENELRDRITTLWEEVEWDWFRKNGDSDYLTWHWSPNHEWHIDHQLIGWNETMITYFLAIASPTHGVDPEMYYSGWASQDQKAQDYRSDWGKTKNGSMYTNGQEYFGIPLKVGVGVGGPLFFVHYSYLGLDPHQMEDKWVNYFENNRDIVNINYRYSVENPGNYEGYGPQSWGLTASDGPEGYKAREAKPAFDDGTIAPTGAIASFPYTPEKSMAALKKFYHENGKFLWGEYGFRDAFNLSEDWVAEIFMGLNQAPMVVMIENYRSGFLWDLFMKNEEAAATVEKIKQIQLKE